MPGPKLEHKRKAGIIFHSLFMSTRVVTFHLWHIWRCDDPTALDLLIVSEFCTHSVQTCNTFVHQQRIHVPDTWTPRRGVSLRDSEKDNITWMVKLRLHPSDRCVSAFNWRPSSSALTEVRAAQYSVVERITRSLLCAMRYCRVFSAK